MERINNAIGEIITALKENDIYKEYKEAEKELSSADREKLDALKYHREMVLNTASWEDRVRAEEIYRSLMLSSSARRYILSEKKLLKIISDIYEKIGQIM